MTVRESGTPATGMGRVRSIGSRRAEGVDEALLVGLRVELHSMAAVPDRPMPNFSIAASSMRSTKPTLARPSRSRPPT